MTIRGHLFSACSLLLTMLSLACSSDTPAPHSKYVETPERVYLGLKGQKVAVMVWSDWRTRTEYNQIQIDTARLLQNKLDALLNPKSDEKEKKEQQNTQFINPGSVVRYQREHPEINGMPIEQVAPKLGVTRVVYVEFSDFSAQSPVSIMLLKGHAEATLRVVEVDQNPDGTKVGHLAFEEANISANYPPDAPEGVTPSDKVNVRTIYEGTLDLLTDKLGVRFAPKE